MTAVASTENVNQKEDVSMSIKENKAVVHRFYEEISKGNLA